MVWKLVLILVAVMAAIALLWPPDLKPPAVLAEPLPVKAAQELEEQLLRATASASDEKLAHLLAKTLAESRLSEVEALRRIISKLKNRLAVYEPPEEEDGLPQSVAGLTGP